ncbi:VCBS repeat protein [Flavobacteriaceae bacterium MAR_2009_75]|nr:VCBS repeat protein [Flavobacteriaceae bacterium MAR_2009_75]
MYNNIKFLKQIKLFNGSHLKWLPFFIILSCTSSKEEKQLTLYKTHCASCHALPSIEALPKNLWQDKVLPEMAARMGVRDSTNNPYEDLSLVEQGAVLQTGIYPTSPIISLEDWALLKEYIINNAPNKLVEVPPKDLNRLSQFKERAIALDSSNGSSFSYLKFNSERNSIYAGTLRGQLLEYNFKNGLSEKVLRAGSTITDYTQIGDTAYLTTIGFMLPSEIPAGNLGIKEGQIVKSLPQKLHRPVHTLIHDFNNDGKNELVISEFGDLQGKLAFWKKNEKGHFIETVLIKQPGFVKSVAADMNNDGLDDIISLSSQGNEGVVILFQGEDTKFFSRKVLSFPPHYGSSWFEIVDFDNDGNLDLITAHGDNADETYVMKPYHGMRIHLNDGANNFDESFFYQMHGCTRISAKDFDQDGDIDIALLSTFPDYENHTDETFVYLENNGSSDFKFTSHVLSEPNAGKWFLMDSGDIDSDGDEDIILSTLTYDYSPTPKELQERWNNENLDILLLENLIN